jgi:exonuclease VII small subunit
MLEKKVEHLEGYTSELERRIAILEKTVKTLKTTEKKLALPTKEQKDIKETKDLKKEKDNGVKLPQNQQDFNYNAKALQPPPISNFDRLES